MAQDLRTNYMKLGQGYVMGGGVAGEVWLLAKLSTSLWLTPEAVAATSSKAGAGEGRYSPQDTRHDKEDKQQAVINIYASFGNNNAGKASLDADAAAAAHAIV